MTLSQLIAALVDAKNMFGDVPVKLIDSETGNWHAVSQVLKLHPYTSLHGCMNRDQPVNAIALSKNSGGARDLVLATTERSVKKQVPS